MNRVADALKTYDKAIELAPNKPKNLCLKAEFLNNEDSIRIFDRALSMDPTYIYSYNMKGFFLYNKANLNKDKPKA